MVRIERDEDYDFEKLAAAIIKHLVNGYRDPFNGFFIEPFHLNLDDGSSAYEFDKN